MMNTINYGHNNKPDAAAEQRLEIAIDSIGMQINDVLKRVKMNCLVSLQSV